uniref:Protein kinase domain-containing protein n=1 Tax=viral metagenome TaxID=1070528 RepID=A0A6C0CZL9_9ZZZZ
MTTTSIFEYKQNIFDSKEECLQSLTHRKQTNVRYKNFNHNVFHAGDEEQFYQYSRIENKRENNISDVSLENNIFKNEKINYWSGYNNLNAVDVNNTFRYIFNKFKKGIFVKIVDNKLTVFLPFSKANFTNEWSNQIKVDPSKYGSVKDFISHICSLDNKQFNPIRVNAHINKWYANNCLVRYEYPISENETNVSIFKHLLETLCAERKVPDVEFFVNKRDFPLLTKNGTEPYNNIWNSTTKRLISHHYDRYLPILSMAGNERYADIKIPTPEDWARVQNYEDKWFAPSCRQYVYNFDKVSWDQKIPTAVFRGGTTGKGVTIENNIRLKLAYLSTITEPDENGVKYIDAGITNWNIRPRKIEGEMYLQTIEIDKLPFGLVPKLTPEEQSAYKYIINVEGHVCAFRLSLELSMGCVILLVQSEWKMWYSHMLKPNKHYIPIQKDLSDLVEKIKWCRENDAKCKKIAENAKEFHAKYLQKDGVLDYMQRILVDIQTNASSYLYNSIAPIDNQIMCEYNTICTNYPATQKTVMDINTIPMTNGRTYGLLKSIEYLVNFVNKNSDFEIVATEDKDEIFRNKLGVIRKFNLANYTFAVKTTSSTQKRKEHIHETFISLHCLNKLSRYIPNFAYIFGFYEKGDTINVITEYIGGITMYDYIKSDKFCLQEYILIIIQLALAIKVAQIKCGFIHYDLTPWNIIIQKIQNPVHFDYAINHDQIYRIKTNIIPVIIDFGKSHVIYNNEHHGFINMYKSSSIQDIVTLVVTSLTQILGEKHLNLTDIHTVLNISNFLTNTQYQRKTFKNIKELRSFLNMSHKYTELISQDKYELELRDPLDFINYINTNIDHKFALLLSVTSSYNSIMNTCNAKQIFHYILASSLESRLETFTDVFKSINHIPVNQENEILWYKSIHYLENIIESTKNNLLVFLKINNIDNKPYQKLYLESIHYLDKLYNDKPVFKNNPDILNFDLAKYRKIKYSDETFLEPDKVLSLLKSIDYNNFKVPDFIVLDNIYDISLYRGKYKLANKNIVFNQINIPKIKEYVADFISLKRVAEVIYKSDAAMVETYIHNEKYIKYKNAYNEIFKYL